MDDSGFTVFDTAIGFCGIAWDGGRLAGTQLPEGGERAAWARLQRRFPELARAEPSPWVEGIIARIRRLLTGEPLDVSDVPLDLSRVGSFEAAVYQAARAIPVGRTATYGGLATELGDPAQARSVGQALGRNPWPIVVPCHRITAADGRTGGFSAPGGVATKLKLLEIEGALKAETLPLFSGDLGKPS